MNAIKWPKNYTPGTTDNYVCNEVIIPDLSMVDVWPHLNNSRSLKKTIKRERGKQ